MSARARSLLLCLALAAGSALVYAPVLDHDFVSYGDRQYVYENRGVVDGLSLATLHWAFTEVHAARWQPLTWISHQLDVSLFEFEPRGHHATNVALHALNTALLFLWLQWASGATRRSAVVAALFALHPLQIDSVAWIAQRKTLLSTSFGFLAILAYLWHCARPGAARMAAVATLLAASLLAQPMLVTLPLLLLLLDYWPLQRLDRASLAKRVLEKGPLLLLALGACVVALWAQGRGTSADGLEAVPPTLRQANAALCYAVYAAKLVWPTSLAVLHPHAGAALSAASVGLAHALLLGAGVAVAVLGRKRRYLHVGALWFAASLLPVIGLVQLGNQAYAEHHVYLPMIGAAIAGVWLAADGLRGKRAAALGLAASALVAALLLTRMQLPQWSDNLALFSQAAAVHAARGVETAHAAPLYQHLGLAVEESGRPEEALAHYRHAAELQPTFAAAQGSWGAVLEKLGRLGEAVPHFEHALAADPQHRASLYALARWHFAEGDNEAAKPLVQAFFYQGVHSYEQRATLVRALVAAEEHDFAVRFALLAARYDPSDAGARYWLAQAALGADREHLAALNLGAAVALDPGSRVLRQNLAHLYASARDPGVFDPRRAVAIMEGLAKGAPLDDVESRTLARARTALSSRSRDPRGR